jgi:hypothetical protein
VGWVVDGREGEPDQVTAAVLGEAGPEAEVRGLGISWGPEWSIRRFSVDKAIREGWAFDPVIDAWRSPDEPAVLPGDPISIETLEIRIKSVAWGWVGLEVGSGSSSVRLLASDMHDPFFDGLGAWIEAVSRGRAARRTSDRLDKLPTYLHAIPKDAGQRMRFVITTERLDVMLDLELSAPQLASAFVACCRELANHPHFAVHWASWGSLNTEQDDLLGDPRSVVVSPDVV